MSGVKRELKGERGVRQQRNCTKIWRLLGLLIVGLGLGARPNVVRAAPTPKPTVIRHQVKHDLRHVGGRWSVQISRLGRHPVNVTVGNRQVGRQRAASTIKLYIMLSIFQRVKRHRLTLTSTVKHRLKRMIYNSDNVAANQLIKTAGGRAAVNRVIAQHHFGQTILGRRLMDVTALRHGHDNWTSTRDLTRFLTRLAQHRLLGKTQDKRMLRLLRHCRNHSKLPRLVKHATVYNKTGEYPALGVQNDAAYFNRHGQKIIIVVLSQGSRPARQLPAMAQLGKHLVSQLSK